MMGMGAPITYVNGIEGRADGQAHKSAPTGASARRRMGDEAPP